MAEAARIQLETIYVVETCISCGCTFALPQTYQYQRRQDHLSFYCPNGHSQCYLADSDLLKARRALEAAQNETLNAKQDAEWQRKLREKTERKMKKLERRIKNGVCPCCQRHFTDVQRHIETKHPDYATQEAKAR